jgi:HD-like signal output (HDOD) protein
MAKKEILEEIQNKMESLGDLPVFSASINQVCSASTDPNANAMSLSKEVLKDANLSVKLLRLANSPYYNRGSKVSVISRAVIMIGFEAVKNLSLTMKLIESFQHEHPGIDMDKLLVRAYITAGFVRDLSIKIGIKDAEQTYTCALLHGLGEIAVAYFLPSKYIEIENLNKEALLPPVETEKAILGTTMSEIGQGLAESWEFSPNVIATMDHEIPEIKNQITKPQELDKVLSSLAANIVSSLYSDKPASENNLDYLMSDLATASGVKLRDVSSSLSSSFKMSCELAKQFGLPAKKLMPAVGETGDEGRDRIARQFSFLASSQEEAEQAEKAVKATNQEQTQANTNPAASTATVTSDTTAEKDDAGLNPELQLQFIQEITSLITDSAKLNTVLIKVLEGIHSAVGFSRVTLCLLNIDRSSYSARIVIGTDKDQLKDFFDRKVDINKDIFSRSVLEGTDILVEDTQDKRWETLLPSTFHSSIGSKSFAFAALRSGVKPLGFIYADKGATSHPVSPEQHRGFIQFVAQARLALQTCR